MDPATKKQFRVSALAVLLCILLVGCSDSTTSYSAPVSTDTTTVVYVPHGEVEWTCSYASDEALAEEVENEGFLVLKETVELTAEGRAEQIITEAAIWADALYNTPSAIGSESTNSLQAQTALQAMENGLFADATNTIEIFANNSDIISVTFTYQYSYEEEADGTARAILDQVTVASSNNGKTASMTYTRQADGTMAAQSSGSSVKSQIEQILGFTASYSKSLSAMVSSVETTDLIAEMGKNALADVQELVAQEGYTFDTLSTKTDLYEAGTRHIEALNQSWEIYRYATKDELYLREFNRLQDANGAGFIADLYDRIVDSSKKTDTNDATLQRAIGTVHDGKVAAVYITYEYGVTASNLKTYTIQAVGIDGIPATEIDTLMYADSFADLLALYRAYEDKGATMGYDLFLIQSNTFVRYPNRTMWSKATSSSEEESGISAADEGDDDELDGLDGMMGVDTGTADSELDDDLDGMMGVDTDPTPEQSGGGTGETSVNCYYPYASTYEENRSIMNAIWSELGVANPGVIGEYVQQQIDLANSAVEAAEALVEEVFEGR